MLGGDSSGEELGADTGCDEVLYWYDPMVPTSASMSRAISVHGYATGSKMCRRRSAGRRGRVSISSTQVQNFGIRTAEAEYGVLEPDVSVTGTLAYNGSE